MENQLGIMKQKLVGINISRITGFTNIFGQFGQRAKLMVGEEDNARNEIKASFHKFIQQFDDIDAADLKENEEVAQSMLFLVNIVAHGRCPVKRDFRKNVEYLPQPEGPARLMKQLTQLGIGLALVSGKNEIDFEVYGILKKIGRDLLPAIRLKAIKHLWDSRAWEYSDGWQTTREVAFAVNVHTGTAKYTLEDLMMVGVLNRSIDGDHDTAAYRWQLSERICEWIGQAGLFDD